MAGETRRKPGKSKILEVNSKFLKCFKKMEKSTVSHATEKMSEMKIKDCLLNFARKRPLPTIRLVSMQPENKSLTVSAFSVN